MARTPDSNLETLRSNTSESNQFRNIRPTRRVCRNLFGPVDHKELHEEIKHHKREHLQEKKSKYNFDFENETPLAGRYLWQKVLTCSKCCKLTKDTLNSKIKTATWASSVKNDEILDTDATKHKITDFFRSKKRKHEEVSQDKKLETENNTPRLNQHGEQSIKRK